MGQGPYGPGPRAPGPGPGTPGPDRSAKPSQKIRPGKNDEIVCFLTCLWKQKRTAAQLRSICRRFRAVISYMRSNRAKRVIPQKVTIFACNPQFRSSCNPQFRSSPYPHFKGTLSYILHSYIIYIRTHVDCYPALGAGDEQHGNSYFSDLSSSLVFPILYGFGGAWKVSRTP